eukprot:scaffold5398_cov240-Ochromonas_danica.AAC.2
MSNDGDGHLLHTIDSLQYCESHDKPVRSYKSQPGPQGRDQSESKSQHTSFVWKNLIKIGMSSSATSKSDKINLRLSKPWINCHGGAPR